MARVPLPPIPSRCVDVELRTRSRRAGPTATIQPGGTTGEVWRFPQQQDESRWVVCAGDADQEQLRAAGAALVQAVVADLRAEVTAGSRATRTVQLHLPAATSSATITALATGIRLGSYQYRVSGHDSKPGLRTIGLVPAATADDADVEAWEHALRRARELTDATVIARDLANTPSNVKNPAWLANRTARLFADIPNLHVTVRDRAWLVQQRFGGLLAVGSGSASAPRLIEARYRPRGAQQHLLLVGKGITFDTGGLSIKPADGMHLMRTDMAGGAAVLAAIRAVAVLQLPVRVTALVPAAENHVSGSAYRPGDVVRHYGGRTSEVSNTDAEGRMVLADALSYGTRRFEPDATVDVATLTGAMKVALGTRTGGVFATTDELARRVSDAGVVAGEPWWRMPLLAAHADAVRSRIADVRQAPEGPGAVVAALFLREFTGNTPWAHLDIAGPARAEDAYADVVPGATGFATRTLVELVASYV